MKTTKDKEKIIKEQIVERNNRIENYILNYLLNKNTPNNSYINNSSNTINISKEKTNKSPPIPILKKISSFRPKISKIHQKKINNELSKKSYIHYINNNKQNIKYSPKNLNNRDNDDILSMGSRKTMDSVGQFNNDNKENLNINYSNMTNSTYSNIEINKNRNSSFINNYKKNISISENEYLNKNLNCFLKKIPKLKKNPYKKGINSYFSFNNKNNLNVNISKNINHSYGNLTISHKINNSININNKRKNNINENSFNVNNLKETNKDNNICKANTIDSIRTIKKINNPTIYVIDNNSKTIEDNYIYNKKNNYSSFSHEKKLRNKSHKNSLTVKNILNKKIYGGLSSSNDIINLEDFLLIIQKFEDIKSLINSLPGKINNNKKLLVIINRIRIKIYDLYKYYFGCTFEGKPEILFNVKKVKINLHYYSIIFVLSLSLIYIFTNKVKMTQEYFPQIINLFNFQQKLFLLLSDMVIHKIKINKGQKIWVREIMNILNNKLMFNTENYLLDMKKLVLNSYYLINEILVELKFKNENGLIDLNGQEIYYMNFYLNNNLSSLFKYNISHIEEIFNNHIFSIFNIKSNYANIASRSNKSFKSICTKPNLFNITFNDSLEIIVPIQKNPVKINPKIPFLKFSPKKEYTLILDLDETLIYFKILNPNKRFGRVKFRPGLINFLEIIKEFYEIIIFTSGTKEYADIILNAIEKKGNNKYFDGRLYREHNVQIGQKFYKDLSKIGRCLSRSIIVDNFNLSFRFQRDNGILISSFYGDNGDDKALIELQKILIKIYNEKGDVRKSIIKYKEEIFRRVSCLNK